MPFYFYEVRDSAGEVILGEAEAPTKLELVEELQSLNYQIIGIREKPTLAARMRKSFALFSRVNLLELALFTRQFSLLMSAGIPILKSLATLLKQNWSPRLRNAIVDIYQGLNDGRSLSTSMNKHPGAFGPVYVNLVKAGEISGGLEDILKRLSDFLERDLKLYRKLQASLTYPIMIFVVSIGITLFLMLYVFPSFVRFFDGLSLELPWLSKIVLTITKTMTDPWVFFTVCILSPILLFQTFAYFATTAAGRYQWSKFLLHFPIVRVVHRNVVLARFCRTLGILIECAVPQLTALEVVSTVVGNSVVQEEIQEVAVGLRDGHTSLARELAEAEFMPEASGQMLRAAEEAGKLPMILGRLADFYDGEVELSLLQLLALLEPAMLMVMGLFVGFILLAVFMPIYSLLDAL